MAGGASIGDPPIGHAVAATNPSKEPSAGSPPPGAGPCAGQMMQLDGRGAASLLLSTGAMMSSMTHLQASPQMTMSAPMISACQHDAGWPSGATPASQNGTTRWPSATNAYAIGAAAHTRPDGRRRPRAERAHRTGAPDAWSPARPRALADLYQRETRPSVCSSRAQQHRSETRYRA